VHLREAHVCDSLRPCDVVCALCKVAIMCFEQSAVLRGRLLLTRDSFGSFRTRLLGAWAELPRPCKKDRLEHSLTGKEPQDMTLVLVLVQPAV
jgi:hypothetical protein